jgi:branched-chain amino acid transport system permease protein
MTARPNLQAFAWAAFALALLAAPLVFRSGTAVAVLCQMGGAIVFGLAYNMLLGQGGMLSFGHAVYYGLGCFLAVHAMNLAGRGALWLPLPLVPLAGALAGLAAGVVFGFVTTRRAGTSFAMITFGIGELVFVAASIFPTFFGGEVGVTSSRVYGKPLFGLTFGPTLQVYYLIAAWVLLAAAGMYWFTCTPLGRLANAVRDNGERVAFVGYNAQRIRYFTLVLSATFSGMAGGLAAVNYESATLESLGPAQSGTVLLFTFIGGAGYFAGPIIGAVAGTIMTLLVSGMTKAWPLYLGLFFVLVVKFAPGGIAGLLVDGWRYARTGELRRQWRPLALSGMLGVCSAAGLVFAIEMVYHRTVATTVTPVMTLAGREIDTSSPLPWLVSIGVAASAAGLLWWASRPLRASRNFRVASVEAAG